MATDTEQKDKSFLYFFTLYCDFCIKINCNIFQHFYFNNSQDGQW